MMKVQEAVELALWLAVTAEKTKDVQRCVQIAEELATQLTPAQVKEAKANVEKKLASK
jgi:predicted Abi (CAAX) family protease